MSTKLIIILYLSILLAFASIQTLVFAATTDSDPYLDQVISWNDVSQYNSDDINIILGPPVSENGFTLSSGDELIVAFTDNIVFDGPGDDIMLYEHGVVDELESVDVWASVDNDIYVYLGNAQNNQSYDLSDYEGLDFIKYLKLIGTSEGGSDPGYDLLAIEAINSLSVPVPGAALLFGSGLMGFWGLKRKRVS